MSDDNKTQLAVIHHQDDLYVAIVQDGQPVRVFAKERCAAIYELEGRDKLLVQKGKAVDLYDPHSDLQGTVITVAKYRDRFGQQAGAMVEQFDGDRHWFVSLNQARRFMIVHGMLEVPDNIMTELRINA